MANGSGATVTLERVRRELDDMSEWRLTTPFTAQEAARYRVLLGYERLLLWALRGG